jgi:nitronate monooxygenase
MSLPPILSERLRLPAVASPLFIISNPALVIAQCKAGVVGSFPALNARPKEALDEWLTQIAEELKAHDAAHPEAPSAPFAVNQIVHKSNDRLEHDLELCVKHRVPIVITSLGARTDVCDAIHSYGGIVLHDIIDNTFAQKAISKGADGLVAVAAGAGGHAGTRSPLALIQEIRAWFDGPLLLSGSIATGRSVLAAQAMGADLAYIGSAFIATHEANAVDGYKQMIVESGSADIIYTNLFTGVSGNYLKPSVIAAGLDPDALPVSDATKMNFGSDREKPKAWKEVWGCGQGIGAVKSIEPAGELVRRLIEEYRAAVIEMRASMDFWDAKAAPVTRAFAA